MCVYFVFALLIVIAIFPRILVYSLNMETSSSVFLEWTLVLFRQILNKYCLPNRISIFVQENGIHTEYPITIGLIGSLEQCQMNEKIRKNMSHIALTCSYSHICSYSMGEVLGRHQLIRVPFVQAGFANIFASISVCYLYLFQLLCNGSL